MAHIDYTEDGKPFIRDDWYLEDVASVCEQMDVTLTEDQMEDVLHDIVNGFDANHGISWDTFEYVIHQHNPVDKKPHDPHALSNKLITNALKRGDIQ